MGTRTVSLVLAVLAGCAAPVHPEEGSLDDPLGQGKADGDSYCSLEQVRLAVSITELELPAQVCHDRTSQRVEVGESVEGELLHEVVSGDTFSLGCTLLHGEVDVEAPVDAEAHVFRIPVVPGDAIRASLDGGRAALDLLVLSRLSESTRIYQFVDHEDEVEALDDGGDSHVHGKNGERFIVVRVRPDQICPNDDRVEYRLSVSGG